MFEDDTAAPCRVRTASGLFRLVQVRSPGSAVAASTTLCNARASTLNCGTKLDHRMWAANPVVGNLGGLGVINAAWSGNPLL